MFDQIPDCWDGLPDKVSAGGELGSQERAVWDNGDIRLTSKAVLLAADTDRPKVIPLEAINEVKVDYGCLVLCAAEGDVWSSVLDNPEAGGAGPRRGTKSAPRPRADRAVDSGLPDLVPGAWYSSGCVERRPR